MLFVLVLTALLRQGPVLEPPAALVERFLEPEAQPLTSYRAHRHLRASTRGGKMIGEMDVLTMLDPERGFTFEVLSESGSSLIRRRVLLAALLAEQRAATAARQEVALTRDNYDFGAAAPADDAPAALSVRARRKSVMLVNGTLFLDSDADLVRVEGELADRPSFWTRKVRVTRRYGKIGGVHVPVRMESVADIRIVGASTFEMSYRYLEINGHPVETTR